MNKNISIYSLICIAFATISFGTSAIAEPINSPLTSNNFSFRNDNEVALNESNNESRDNLTKITLFFGLIGTCALFWTVFKSRQSSTQSSFQQIGDRPNKALLDRVSPRLRRQLLRLVNDPKTANRLLMGIYKNNSDRSPNWIAEKAIYDLRRGR